MGKSKPKTKSAPKPKKSARGRPAIVDPKAIDKATKLLAKTGQTSKQIADYLLSVGARRFLALYDYANK